MKMIGEVTGGKPSYGLLFPINTEKATRVGMRWKGIRYTQWIDHFLVSSSLRDLCMPPAVVYDTIGDISDHYPILLQFKDK
jgi:exonuclease III